MIKENTFSLHRLLEEYVGEREPFEYGIEANSESFYVVKEQDPKYVQPFLKDLYSNCTMEEVPQILCIAATGASGKSAMAEYISATKHCPIFSLGNHPAVADSALVGVLYNSLGYQNISSFLCGLQEGKSLIIIDGADEGMVKVGNFEAFKTFLKGVADIAAKSPKTTFIILGRVNAMEIVHLVLEEYKIKTCCVRIEAFTEGQAQDFINKSTGKNDSDVAYVQLRNYILGSVGDIFKDQHDIKVSEYQKFIGYAPVLMSIAKLISSEPNPHRLYQELSRQGVKNIDLLINIVESILERDKENKIKQIVLTDLVKNRDEEFQRFVYESVYTKDEQCYRVLAKAMKQDITLAVTGDREFDNKYEEHIKDWVEDHPFYDNEKKSIQNTVFESYIISTLINNAQYRSLVFQYLQSKYKDAFMLFYIYDALHRDDKSIDIQILPYILASAHSLDDNEHKVEVQIEEDEVREKETTCDVRVKSIEKEFTFTLMAPSSDAVYLGDDISNTSLIIPSLCFELNRFHSNLMAPIFIQCAKLYTQAGDFQVELSPCKTKGSVIIDCEEVIPNFTNGQQYRFYISGGDESFKVFSDVAPGYPFDKFWHNDVEISKLTGPQVKVYQKLRRTMSLFKSHSKGRLAKFKDKIDNRRWLGSDEWKFLLDALLDNGIFYVEENFYFISPDNLSKCLGVSYDQLRDGEVTPKIVDFITTIKP